MSDETNEQTNDSGDGGGESPNVKRMREQIEALKEQNTALSAVAKQAAFKEAGLDPTKGIGKAVYRTYDGEIDPENISTFAREEYDWEPKGAGVSDAQQRMTAISQVGSAEEARNRIEQAEAAASEGDWVKSAALKDAELLAITRKRNHFE